MRRSRKGTLSLNPSAFIKACLVLIFFLFFAGQFVGAESPGETALLSKVKQIETRLTQIESGQKAILEKQQEIISRLETLRIWVRRS